MALLLLHTLQHLPSSGLHRLHILVLLPFYMKPFIRIVVINGNVFIFKQ